MDVHEDGGDETFTGFDEKSVQVEGGRGGNEKSDMMNERKFQKYFSHLEQRAQRKTKNTATEKGR